MKDNAVICPPCGENVGLPTKGGAYKGFTLIELLVVVLIIGILVAVALPQYKLAVTKSRVSIYLPLLKSIADAEEAYYLSAGEYTAYPTNLDVDIPQSCSFRFIHRAQRRILEGACSRMTGRGPIP